MMSDTHEQWTERLSGYIDGDLSPDEHGALEEHLSECSSCRRVLEELRDVVARASELGETRPERDLWPGVAAAIGGPLQAVSQSGSGDVIQLPVSRPGSPRKGLFFTAPQLAAASIVLVVASAAATLWAGPGLGVRSASESSAVPSNAVLAVSDPITPPPDLAEELAGLEAALADARAELDPNTVRILEKNLGVIERAIDESVRALAVDPGNEFLREHLNQAFREKAGYLREVVDIARWNS